MDERDRIDVEGEPRTVERHTTVVTSGGDRGSGGGTLIAAVLLIIVLLLLFFLFGDRLTGGGTDIEVDVRTPDVELPAIGNGG